MLVVAIFVVTPCTEEHTMNAINNPAAIESALVQYIRAICAAELCLPVDHPFFAMDALDGETSDETLVRLFLAERRHQDSDRETVLTLCHG